MRLVLDSAVFHNGLPDHSACWKGFSTGLDKNCASINVSLTMHC